MGSHPPQHLQHLLPEWMAEVALHLSRLDKLECSIPDVRIMVTRRVGNRQN